jgi:hypothetical protein
VAESGVAGVMTVETRSLTFAVSVYTLSSPLPIYKIQ